MTKEDRERFLRITKWFGSISSHPDVMGVIGSVDLKN
jgi:hypothetical protein